jgi:hypothetical protein
MTGSIDSFMDATESLLTQLMAKYDMIEAENQHYIEECEEMIEMLTPKELEIYHKQFPQPKLASDVSFEEKSHFEEQQAKIVPLLKLDQIKQQPLILTEREIQNHKKFDESYERFVQIKSAREQEIKPISHRSKKTVKEVIAEKLR